MNVQSNDFYMSKNLFVVIIFNFITIGVFSQKGQLIYYPYREIFVSCDAGTPTKRNVYNEECYIVQTRDEYKKFCTSRDASVNFVGEFMLGAKVTKHLHTKHSYDSKIINFRVEQDNVTNIIHFFVYYEFSISKGKFKKEVWVAIRKPIGKYEVHVHFITENSSNVLVFDNL